MYCNQQAKNWAAGRNYGLKAGERELRIHRLSVSETGRPTSSAGSFRSSDFVCVSCSASFNVFLCISFSKRGPVSLILYSHVGWVYTFGVFSYPSLFWLVVFSSIGIITHSFLGFLYREDIRLSYYLSRASLSLLESLRFESFNGV